MTNSSLSDFSVKQLRKAIRIKEKIETLQAELSQLLGDFSSVGLASKPKRKHKMSAAGRARIAAAAKARWAKVKAAQKK